MARDLSNLSPELVSEIQHGLNLIRTTVYAIKVGDQWFAGFGDAQLTRFKRGLHQARFIEGSNPQKVDEYLRRLQQRGFHGVCVRLVMDC